VDRAWFSDPALDRPDVLLAVSYLFASEFEPGSSAGA
jgi:hypothetical protein